MISSSDLLGDVAAKAEALRMAGLLSEDGLVQVEVSLGEWHTDYLRQVIRHDMYIRNARARKPTQQRRTSISLGNDSDLSPTNNADTTTITAMGDKESFSEPLV